MNRTARTFNGPQYETNMAGLPELCFIVSPEDGLLVIIMAGESGFYPVDADRYPLAAGESVEQQVLRLNRAMDIGVAQSKAMMFGSMFGFDVPGADPARYRVDQIVVELGEVDPRLGDEAAAMRKSGATYEDILARFRHLYDEAAKLRAEEVA